MTTETTTRDMTLVNVTTDIFGNASDGPVYMWQLEELLAEWNAEGIAYGELDESDLPHLHISGDEVRYYKSDNPGDYEIVGTIIEEQL